MRVSLDHVEADSSLELFVSLTRQVFIVEAAGRRLLLLCGFGICCGACVLLTVALSLQVRQMASRFDRMQPKSSTLLPSSGLALSWCCCGKSFFPPFWLITYAEVLQLQYSHCFC